MLNMLWSAEGQGGKVRNEGVQMERKDEDRRDGQNRRGEEGLKLYDNATGVEEREGKKCFI